jgi:hypothetical protein
MNLEKIMKNISWIFSGAGVVILLGLYNNWAEVKSFFDTYKVLCLLLIIFLLVLIVGVLSFKLRSKPKSIEKESTTAHGSKKAKHEWLILFIDDNEVEAINTLKSNGWTNIQKINDIENISSEVITKSDILFIDINGVGKKLGFKDEGLGLALALMNRFPNKKYVIYSAQTEGKRIHEALNKADALLEKDAVPFEFITVVENLTE